jgi:hypothetical protein
MADDTPSTTNIGTAHTGGGALIAGSVQANRDFIGRDNILNVTIQLSASELHALTETLLGLLAAPDVQLRANGVSAGERALQVSPAMADALRQFLDATPGQSDAERARQYLAHLCVNPDFQRWQQRYVTLAGGYRAAPELTPAYSAILVRGEGPQRQIVRVPLPDIRTALERHPRFILLAQPGAGKTTVLQRMALDSALAYLQGQPEARLPLFVRLASQGAQETPHEFLARQWREQMPGSPVDAPSELRSMLR